MRALDGDRCIPSWEEDALRGDEHPCQHTLWTRKIKKLLLLIYGEADGNAGEWWHLSCSFSLTGRHILMHAFWICSYNIYKVAQSAHTKVR